MYKTKIREGVFTDMYTSRKRRLLGRRLWLDPPADAKHATDDHREEGLGDEHVLEVSEDIPNAL